MKRLPHLLAAISLRSQQFQSSATETTNLSKVVGFKFRLQAQEGRILNRSSFKCDHDRTVQRGRQRVKVYMSVHCTEYGIEKLRSIHTESRSVHIEIDVDSVLVTDPLRINSKQSILWTINAMNLSKRLVHCQVFVYCLSRKNNTCSPER